MHCTSISRKMPVYSPENAMSGIPLSPERKFVLLMRVWGVLQTVALHAPRRSLLEAKWSTSAHQRYGAKNGPAKVATSCHYKLFHSGYVIFWFMDQIAKFKTRQNKIYGAWPNLMPAKFSHYTVSLLHCSVLPSFPGSSPALCFCRILYEKWEEGLDDLITCTMTYYACFHAWFG